MSLRPWASCFTRGGRLIQTPQDFRFAQGGGLTNMAEFLRKKNLFRLERKKNRVFRLKREMRRWVEKNVFLDSVCPVSLITKVWSQNSWHLPFIGEKLIISGLTGNAWAERKSDNVIVFYASISPQIIFWAILFLPVWLWSLFFGLFPIFPDTSGHSALSKPQRSCRTTWDNKGQFFGTD